MCALSNRDNDKYFFPEPSKKWDVNEIVSQDKSQSKNLPISQNSENSISNLPIAEPSQISLIPSPPSPPSPPSIPTNPTVVYGHTIQHPTPTTRPVIFIDEPKQTTYRREKTIGGSQVKCNFTYYTN